MKRLNDQGSALVLVVFVMLIICFLGFTLMNISTMDYSMSNNQVDVTKAYYIAEAGMNKALFRLRTNQSIMDDAIKLNVGKSKLLINSEKFADGEFFGSISESTINLTVKEINADNRIFIINCIGKYKKAQKKIQTHLKISLNPEKIDDDETYLLEVIYWSEVL